jgi:hypothetical protein
MLTVPTRQPVRHPERVAALNILMRAALKSLVGQLRANGPGMLWPALFPFILFSTHNNCFLKLMKPLM